MSNIPPGGVGVRRRDCKAGRGNSAVERVRGRGQQWVWVIICSEKAALVRLWMVTALEGWGGQDFCFCGLTGGSAIPHGSGTIKGRITMTQCASE